MMTTLQQARAALAEAQELDTLIAWRSAALAYAAAAENDRDRISLFNLIASLTSAVNSLVAEHDRFIYNPPSRWWWARDRRAIEWERVRPIYMRDIERAAEEQKRIESCLLLPS